MKYIIYEIVITIVRSLQQRCSHSNPRVWHFTPIENLLHHHIIPLKRGDFPHTSNVTLLLVIEVTIRKVSCHVYMDVDFHPVSTNFRIDFWN